MRSSLSYAILALLTAKPQSGYDIVRQMKLPLGFLWQAEHGQIYAELVRLIREGLVESGQLDRGTGRPRRVRAITSAGRAVLSEWVTQPPRPRPMNDEFVVKVFALRKANVATVITMLHNQVKLHERRLATLKECAAAVESRDSEMADPGSARFGEYAALRRGIGAEHDYLAWCRWLQAQLDPGHAWIVRPKGRRRPAKGNGPRRGR